MGSLEDVTKRVGQYQWLVTRALAIVGFDAASPYHKYVGEEEWATVEIEGDTAILKWPESEYESTCIEENSVQFPASLLALDDKEFSAWMAEQRAIQQCQEVENRRLASERRAELARIAENEERAKYEALKRKYEGSADITPWFAANTPSNEPVRVDPENPDAQAQARSK